MALRIILDTGVFFRPDAIMRLAEAAQDIIVPAVVLAERMRQIERDGFQSMAFRRLLDRCHFVVEPLGEAEALRYTTRIHDDDRWNRLARDAMIAGHVGDADVLWTTNPRDFIEAGVPENQIVPVGP